MRVARLVLLVLLMWFPAYIEAQSPKKYRVSYKVSQSPPDFLGKLRVYMNDIEIKKLSKSYSVSSPEKDIVLRFISSNDHAQEFSLKLPAPVEVKDLWHSVIPIETKNKLQIDVTADAQLLRSGSSVSTVEYSINLNER